VFRVVGRADQQGRRLRVIRANASPKLAAVIEMHRLRRGPRERGGKKPSGAE